MPETHHLNLTENSISFFREAVLYAQRGKKDCSQWKFAIINLIQAMELAVKEALRRIHPAFVFEDIDNPKKSVSIDKALSRLKSSHIGKTNLTEKESKNFRTAIQLRNELTHNECKYKREYAEAKFANIFAFMTFFYQQYLDLKLMDFLAEDQFAEILNLKKAKEELLKRAETYIEKEGFPEVWECPECLEGTFIVQNEKCCLCHYSENVVGCPNCGIDVFKSELEDISGLLDYDYSEGEVTIHDDFGYSHRKGCFQCIDEIKEDIESQRFDQYCENMAMEEYYANK